MNYWYESPPFDAQFTDGFSYQKDTIDGIENLNVLIYGFSAVRRDLSFLSSILTYGTVFLNAGQIKTIINFSGIPNVGYRFRYLYVSNFVDSSPFYLPIIAGSKIGNSFNLDLGAVPDSPNYILNWQLIPNQGDVNPLYSAGSI